MITPIMKRGSRADTAEIAGILPASSYAETRNRTLQAAPRISISILTKSETRRNV